MKNIIVLLIVFSFCTAQITARTKDSLTIPELSVKEKAWKATAALGLNVSHFLEVNASPGPDKKSFSGAGSLDLGLNYKKEGARFEMTNEVHWMVNVQKAGLADTEYIKRVNDDFKTLHDYSIGITNKNRISINLIAKTSTSIFTIYNGDYFSDVNHLGRIQGFLSPYEAILSPGLKIQPDKYLRVSISPYSMRFYGLTDSQIANTGLYTTDPDGDGSYTRFEFKQLGAEVNIWYDRQIGSWLEVQYRVGVSAEYLENVGKNGLLDGLFITKIKLFKDLYLSHRAELKGDFSQKPFKPYYGQTILLSYTKSL